MYMFRIWVCTLRAVMRVQGLSAGVPEAREDGVLDDELLVGIPRVSQEPLAVVGG